MKIKVLRFVIGLMAIIIGLYPALYFIIDRRFGLLGTKPLQLLSNHLWNIGFYIHIIMGGIALLIGWTQFSPGLRKRNMSLHRTIGKCYVIAVLFSSLAGIGIAFRATGGIITSLGFISLGIIWFFSTMTGFLSIRRGEWERHQRMMTFSYAACFSAVTLRIWLPLLLLVTGMAEFNTAYRIVAWLCWVPNICVAVILCSRYKIRPATVY